jgi:hypothetical protein
MTTAQGISNLVAKAREEGKLVEIDLPLFGGLQPVTAVVSAGKEWVKITVAGLPDAEHYAPVDRINGVRVRPSDD